VSDSPQGDLSPDLLMEFFSEADEHLTNIRQSLTQLEASIGRAQADLGALQPLFRDFHSLKGLSAIVGLRAAESLAHGTEDFLRELTRGKVTLTAEGLDLLMAATHALEQILAAFRAKQEPREYTELAEQLHRIVQSKDAKPSERLSESASRLVEEAKSRGLVLWKCTFTPARELDVRGLNVTTARERLAQAGEVISSTPRVLGEGHVAFEFVVAMRETPADITAWDKDGLVMELFDAPTAEPPPSPLPLQNDAEHDPFIAPSHVVRVDLERLDDMMRMVGEMIVQRSRFDEEVARSAKRGQSVDMRLFEEINTSMGRSLRELRDAITRMRLVSAAEIFARMPFVVRDLARGSNKRVRIQLEGQQTEIDKYVIEQLKDPMLHLVRNAFSHGVEPVEERRAAGKPEEATIFLKAEAAGDSVIITIGDDGRGVNRTGLKAKARQAGLATADVVDNAEALRILCAPGFSTRDEADRASGRGIGMAVVQNTVRQLGGTLAMESELGVGTRFVITLPLTLAIADTVIVSVADQTCAVPQAIISEVMQIEPKDLRRVNGVEVMPYRSGVLPVIRLSSFFNVPASEQPRLCVLVLRSHRGSSGLVVDRVFGQKEVVVRPIRDPLIQVPGISGATELGNGRPVLILDGAAFTSGAVRPNLTESPERLN